MKCCLKDAIMAVWMQKTNNLCIFLRSCIPVHFALMRRKHQKDSEWLYHNTNRRFFPPVWEDFRGWDWLKTDLSIFCWSKHLPPFYASCLIISSVLLRVPEVFSMLVHSWVVCTLCCEALRLILLLANKIWSNDIQIVYTSLMGKSMSWFVLLL